MSSNDRMSEVAALLQERGWWFGTAESVTAGQIASAAAQAPHASAWLRGGVIAFSEQVKQQVLGVAPGPVVNARTAEQMARGAAAVLDAQVVVATTGVGGPDPIEGQPAGTVFVGVWVDGDVRSHELHLEGEPADICRGATDRALALVADLFLGSVAPAA